MAKETFYFPHDFEPTGDPKLAALVGEFGAVGYGIYWRIIEMLHSDPLHALPQKQYIYHAIAKQMSTPVEQVLNIIEYCTNTCELFYISDSKICCARVFRNIEARSKITSARSEAGKASAEKRKKEAFESTSVQQNPTSVQQNPTKGNKVKESKVKEIKEKEIKESNTTVEVKTSTFQECMKVYDIFIQAQTGLKADIDGLSGKSLKGIIAYLEKNVKDKADLEKSIPEAFEFILKNYERWDKFHQGQLKLNQIKSNLVNIINSIKNGKSQQNGIANPTEQILASINANPEAFNA